MDFCWQATELSRQWDGLLLLLDFSDYACLGQGEDTPFGPGRDLRPRGVEAGEQLRYAVTSTTASTKHASNAYIAIVWMSMS